MYIKTGVIGSGSISDIYLTNMINHFQNLNVIAIASKHIENAEKKAEKYGIRACTVEEMMNDSEIEMVVVLTPTSTHYELAREALLHGKHVYTEKTITHDFAKTLELVKLADEKGLYLGSAPDTFFGAAWQTARKAIDEGILGDINSFVISTNRNNDILLSIFSFLRMPGGGVLHDFGSYYLTALVALLGSVKRVGGICRAPFQEHLNIIPGKSEYGEMMKTPYESEISAILQLENGITGTFHIDAETSIKDQNCFKIYGTKGILILSDPNQFGGTVRLISNTMNLKKPVNEVDLLNFSPYEENSRGIGPSDMADAIIKGEKNRASKELALHVHEVINAIINSGESGKFIDIESHVERPQPVINKKAPITNIGHPSFRMKNDEAMLNFYQNILGMKKQFTMTVRELLDSFKKDGADLPEEMLNKYKDTIDNPWITYMKLSDHQFVELFHNNGKSFKHMENRYENYGYTKLNFEVDSIEDIKNQLIGGGVEIAEDIHKVVDGSLEIKVYDPDGNEVQFTEYAKGEDAMLPLTEDIRKSCSNVKYTTQVAFQTRETFNMLNFYTSGLGLKKVKTLTYADLYNSLKNSGLDNQMILTNLKAKGETPWIHYIEVAPHQFIELFNKENDELQGIPDLAEYDGYQHICLEVSDIHEALEACVANGIKPDTEISLGPDGAYQFWLTDPDGNRLELMEYTKDAYQLKNS